MYQIIENPKIMSKDEIRKSYYGKWVFVVNAIISKHGKFIEGIPVILGNYQFEGIEDGIYDKYKGDEYGQTYSHMLIPMNNTISSVFGMEFV